VEFYEIKFDEAPAWEGEDFAYVPRKTCDECGLKAIAVSSQFLVPEDTVASLSLETEDDNLADLFEAAGMLIAKVSLAKQMESEGITGFHIRSATILNTDTNMSLDDYVWLAIHGRCETNPVWHQVISRCSICQMEKTEAVRSSVRKVVIRKPLPSVDIFRSRERNAGIMVSGKFREVLLNKIEQVEFKSIPHE